MAIARVLPNIVADEVEYSVDFAASLSENVTVPIGDRSEILIGRLHIDVDPAVNFNQWITLTLYNRSAKHGKDAFYRTVAKITRAEVFTATTGLDANLILNDFALFSPSDLMIIDPTGSPELVRLKTVNVTSVAEDTIVGVHAIGTPVVRVVEFQGPIFCSDGTDTVYGKLEFDTVQTIHLNMAVTMRT